MIIVNLDKVGSFASMHARLKKFERKYRCKPDWFLVTKKKTLREYFALMGKTEKEKEFNCGFYQATFRGIPFLISWQIGSL